LTLKSAAAKGLVSASAGTSAAQPLAALAPGQVMHAVGRKLMKQENDENSGEGEIAMREGDRKVEEAERKIEETITQLGFDLKVAQSPKT
jgi:hypothetical protein